MLGNGMTNGRKGDKKGKVFQELEQKLGMGENMKPDTSREL